MGIPFLLEDVVGELFINPSQPAALFGKHNYFKLKGTRYDLFFAQQLIHTVDHLCDPDFLVVPVYPHSEDGEKVTAITLLEQYQRNPNLQLFATRDIKKVVCSEVVKGEQRQTERTGPFLSFFDIAHGPGGSALVRKVAYLVASQEDCLQKVADPDRFLTDLREFTRRVQHRYHS